MMFDSNHVIETLERLYQQRITKMSQSKKSYSALQTLIMEAEMNALNQAVQKDQPVVRC